MSPFTDLVRGSESVREIKQKFPETEPVFEKFRIRSSCHDCPVEYAARQVGAPLDDLLVEVNKVIYRKRGVPA